MPEQRIVINANEKNFSTGQPVACGLPQIRDLG